uniref:Uncharacterized protein n=1 Tax=Lepeophtheirus salmonis TaxID=72036 RepID=A0A0K2U8A5_LEPSM
MSPPDVSSILLLVSFENTNKRLLIIALHLKYFGIICLG